LISHSELLRFVVLIVSIIKGIIMATHQQIYLDEEAEQTLQTILQTGLDISDALKKGLLLLQQQINVVSPTPTIKPFDIYAQLDLGEGGYALFPSSQAKIGIKTILRKKLSQ
jgi:hypothetical protein